MNNQEEHPKNLTDAAFVQALCGSNGVSLNPSTLWNMQAAEFNKSPADAAKCPKNLPSLHSAPTE